MHRQQKNLILKNEEGSCQPSAVNLYFNQPLFTSLKQFYELQKSNLARKYWSRKEIVYDTNLLNSVIVGGQTYWRSILFETNAHDHASMNSVGRVVQELRSAVERHQVVLVDYTYYDEEDTAWVNDMGHVTLVERKRGGLLGAYDVEHVRHPILPYTKLDMNMALNESHFKQKLSRNYHIDEFAIFIYELDECSCS